MEGQINNLQKKLDDRENNKEFKEKNDKLKFNEGSLWMSKYNFILVGRCFNEMENMKNKVDELLDDYQNRIPTHSYNELESQGKGGSFNSGWLIQMVGNLINQTLLKFKDMHFNNVKTVESLTSYVNI